MIKAMSAHDLTQDVNLHTWYSASSGRVALVSHLTRLVDDSGSLLI